MIIKYGINANIFAEKKNVSSFCKSYSHFFSKNTCELDIVLTRKFNILTPNELVKLTMLWTTGPWSTTSETYFRTYTPAHSCSLIRIFTGCILGSQGCKVYLYAQHRLIRMRGCGAWLESSLGAHVKGHVIMKTCLYNVDPLKPHFYIVKLGLTWVYIIFLISAQKHRLWVLFRTASSRLF